MFEAPDTESVEGLLISCYGNKIFSLHSGLGLATGVGFGCGFSIVENPVCLKGLFKGLRVSVHFDVPCRDGLLVVGPCYYVASGRHAMHQ